MHVCEQLVYLVMTSGAVARLAPLRPRFAGDGRNLPVQRCSGFHDTFCGLCAHARLQVRRRTRSTTVTVSAAGLRARRTACVTVAQAYAETWRSALGCKDAGVASGAGCGTDCLIRFRASAMCVCVWRVSAMESWYVMCVCACMRKPVDTVGLSPIARDNPR